MAQEMMQLVQSNPQIHGPGGTYEAYRRMYAALGADNIDALLMPPPDTNPKPMESGMENSGLMMGGPAQAFPEQDHDAHIATHVTLLNMASCANECSNTRKHTFTYHAAFTIESRCNCPTTNASRGYAAISTIATTSSTMPPVEAAPVHAASSRTMLAQFSSPIMSELMQSVLSTSINSTRRRSLVTIRKQELALKGQELSQDQEQFESKEQNEMEEKSTTRSN